jgi:peptide/nickel transport system substrate-binding protein
MHDLANISRAIATAAMAIGVAQLGGGPAYASELRIGFSQGAQTLDPANHRNRETETLIRNMCDGLLTLSLDIA